MAKARYYSPQLDRSLVTQLYFEARRQAVPMTRLASRLIEEGLQRLRKTGSIAEEPVASDPRDRTNKPDH
jgi:hypothetical protein